MPREPFTKLTIKRDLAASLLRVKSICKRSFSAPKAATHNSTNLLAIAVDTMRFDHLGNSGMTPNLDLIAQNGTNFKTTISACPWTLPSFASAMTGVMPSVHQAGLTGTNRDLGDTAPAGLNPEILTLASHLQSQGYKTCALYSNPFFGFGLDAGFDICEYHNLPASDMVMLGLDWIRKNSDQPFFCFLLLNDTHEPTMPKRRFFTPYLDLPATDNQLRDLVRWGNLGKTVCAESLAIKKALYAGAVASVDSAIGKMNETLADWKLADKTITTVFSDHGEEFHDHIAESIKWAHDPRAINGIGHGHSMFNELLHVPWIASGPGVPAQQVIKPVSLCDFAPTVCNWLGVDAMLKPEVAMPEFAGSAKPEDRMILSQEIAYGPDLKSVRHGSWKLVAKSDGTAIALYDLDSDPDEKTDLRDEQPEIVENLVEFVKKWSEQDKDNGSEWDINDRIRKQLEDLGYA